MEIMLAQPCYVLVFNNKTEFDLKILLDCREIT